MKVVSRARSLLGMRDEPEERLRKEANARGECEFPRDECVHAPRARHALHRERCVSGIKWITVTKSRSPVSYKPCHLRIFYVLFNPV